jgi:hypothetical protein
MRISQYLADQLMLNDEYQLARKGAAPQMAAALISAALAAELDYSAEERRLIQAALSHNFHKAALKVAAEKAAAERALELRKHQLAEIDAFVDGAMKYIAPHVYWAERGEPTPSSLMEWVYENAEFSNPFHRGASIAGVNWAKDEADIWVASLGDAIRAGAKRAGLRLTDAEIRWAGRVSKVDPSHPLCKAEDRHLQILRYLI